MNDVGDGLNLSIDEPFRDLTVDLGGDEEKVTRFSIGFTFLLSHFHSDHYNGLFYSLKAGRNHWQVKEFYFPIMPLFYSLLVAPLFLWCAACLCKNHCDFVFPRKVRHRCYPSSGGTGKGLNKYDRLYIPALFSAQQHNLLHSPHRESLFSAERPF